MEIKFVIVVYDQWFEHPTIEDEFDTYDQAWQHLQNAENFEDYSYNHRNGLFVIQQIYKR